MTRYILRRLVISVPVLFGITVLIFLFINLAPGDPVTAMMNPADAQRLNTADLDHLREQLGLNQPLPVRYAIWLGQILQGNLGYSYADKRPVSQHIRERIVPTLELTATSLVFALLLAVPFGIISALRQYSLLDYALTGLSFLSLSFPAFFVALGAIYVFALKLDLLPTSGMYTVGQPWNLWDHLQHLLLPMLILSVERVGPFLRYVRSSMLEVIRQDYVTTARAKGLVERVVIYRHALRNALIPLITVVGLSLPGLFGGAVIIETVFAWPGMGWLSVGAVGMRDYPVLMGLGLVSATLILLSNLLADVLYAVADPRIRYS